MTRVVLGGARAEVIDPSAPIEEYWERLRTDRITTVISTVVLWEKLARHYKTHLKTHPDRDSYLAGISNLRTAVISASVPIPSLLRFYREEIHKPLVITYGSTEMGKVVLGMSAEEEGKMKEHVSECSNSAKMFTNLTTFLSAELDGLYTPATLLSFPMVIAGSF